MNRFRHVKNILFLLVFIAAVTASIMSVVISRNEISARSITDSEVSSVIPIFYAEERININTASGEQLQTLPGIGPVLAERILEYRSSVGQFYDVGELREIKGIGEQILRDLLPYICT